MKLINNKVYFAVQDYLMILLGTLLYGFGFNAFILSNEIITGGVSGICALIFFASNEIIPVSVSYFVINVVLLLAALKISDKNNFRSFFPVSLLVILRMASERTATST